MNYFNQSKLNAITDHEQTAAIIEKVAIVEDLDDKGLLIDFFMSEKEKSEFLSSLERQKAKHKRRAARERRDISKIKSGLKHLNIFSKS